MRWTLMAAILVVSWTALPDNSPGATTGEEEQQLRLGSDKLLEGASSASWLHHGCIGANVFFSSVAREHVGERRKYFAWASPKKPAKKKPETDASVKHMRRRHRNNLNVCLTLGTPFSF